MPTTLPDIKRRSRVANEDGLLVLLTGLGLGSAGTLFWVALTWLLLRVL
jgi:hypothetical protein